MVKAPEGFISFPIAMGGWGAAGPCGGLPGPCGPPGSPGPPKNPPPPPKGSGGFPLVWSLPTACQKTCQTLHRLVNNGGAGACGGLAYSSLS